MIFTSADIPLPDRVRLALNGAVRISTDATSTLNGAPVNGCAYYAAKTVCTLTFDGASTLEIESNLALAALTVPELQEIVTWAGVDTEAATKSGLKRAIERHYE